MRFTAIVCRPDWARSLYRNLTPRSASLHPGHVAALQLFFDSLFPNEFNLIFPELRQRLSDRTIFVQELDQEDAGREYGYYRPLITPHKRLERGWTPTPSRFRDGDEVVGHAACVLE